MPFLEWDTYKNGCLLKLPNLSNVRIQQKAETSGYHAMFKALDKFVDNNLPFYETVYSGVKDHTPYNWQENILDRSGKKSDSRGHDILPNERSLFEATGKHLNNS